MWEERHAELCEKVRLGQKAFKENDPEGYAQRNQKLQEGRVRWEEENPEGYLKNLEKATVALEKWREDNPDKVQGIVDAMKEGRELWMHTEDYQRYSDNRSARMREMGKQRWKCLVSGRISTAAGLSHIQKSLGIDHKDPNNRIQIN
jgi:hypothetical protein